MTLSDGMPVHFVPWLVFAGILWSSIILDITGIKAYLGAGWFKAFLPAALLAGIAPALYLGLAVANGGSFPINAQGMQVPAYAFARPYTPAFFGLCAGIGVVAGLCKGLVLGRFSPDRRRPFPIAMLVLFSTLSATAAISEMNLDSQRLMATVLRLAGVSSRQVAGQPTLDPMKNAKPLLDYYRKLGQQRKP